MVVWVSFIIGPAEFLNLLLEKRKFNKDWFTNNNRTLEIDNMKDGKVDEIRNTLLQILTFIAEKKNKTTTPRKYLIVNL